MPNATTRLITTTLSPVFNRLLQNQNQLTAQGDSRHSNQVTDDKPGKKCVYVYALLGVADQSRNKANQIQ